MMGVFVTFDLGEAYDGRRLSDLAQGALPKFRAMPGLVSKTFTLDEASRCAVNFYVWESEAAARHFFSEEMLAGVAAVYGVRPVVKFAPVVGRVENTAGAVT